MMMRVRWISAGVIAMAALVATVMMTQASCGQTPTNVPVRTFEAAGRMDILCMQVLSTDPSTSGSPIPAVPVSLDNCGPVATGADITQLFYHLIAVVTQTLRGELAVVDLTVGHVVDTSRSLPGINFLPVGQNPTDVVVTPDASRVFVSAAETNKPAIYEIPSARLLGDSAVLAEPTQAAEQTALPSWPACGLPQAPGRMVVVPTTLAGDAGDAGGGQGYEIIVVMPGNGIDEQALAGVIDVAAFDAITPGSLAPCPLTSIVHLDENPAALPTSWTPGPTWPLGPPYLDGGVDLFTTAAPSNAVQVSSNYKLPLWQCPSLAHALDAGADVPDASPLHLAPGGQAHAAGIATDGRYVWVADKTMPFIHVLDTTKAGTLAELAPLVATSMVDPTRTVTTTELAVSPVTRDYKRYLYAVDAKQGSVMVYDVTDPKNGPRLPMKRPNPELAPNQAPDRILFPAPVATLAFARHDFPVPGATGPVQTGVLCNPNPQAGTQGNGVEYRANGPLSVALGPKRLRGVFGFATLTNGQIVTIDVDDWDAPCRRPVALGSDQVGALAQPEPNPFGANDIDPYHAPLAQAGATDAGLNSVSNESMWPIIQPHHIRSAFLVENDTIGTNGLHNPTLVAAPLLLVNGAPTSTTGNPAAILTATTPEAPLDGDAGVALSPATPPNVYVAHDVPDVHIDQTWSVTYEGVLPGFDGLAATISTPDCDGGCAPDFTTLTFSNSNAFFCGRGVEDQRLGLQRFAAMQVDDSALSGANKTSTLIPTRFDQRVGDYVQIADDILGAPNLVDAGQTTPTDDPYWHQDEACWAGITDTNGHALDDSTTAAPFRQQVCFNKYGAYGKDQNTQRDFPILEAYEDHVVVGRYEYLDATNRPSNGRIVAPRDTQAQVDFKLTQCCFHSQAHFRVRTGSEWIALGNLTPYLHHVVADPTTVPPNACVQSCDPTTILLSSRVAETTFISPLTSLTVAPSRNSPFAMRNPALSFFLPTPAVSGADAASFFTVSLRDFQWQFQTRGQYFPESISLVGTTTAVVPTSSMFIPPLGAVGVVDSSAEGLFIIDLNTLLIADGSPFF
jgi:hypothetical protein